MSDEIKVMQLADKIGYHDGSVVSNTIIDKKIGTVTIFAFDKGEGLSEHAAPFDAMVYVLEGEVEITIGGVPHTLKGGDTVIMPADIPHGLKAITRYKMLLIMIRS